MQFVVAEELVEVRPRVDERALDAAARLVGAARKAQRPLHSVIAVVGDLFDRLRGDAREAGGGTFGKLRVELELERRGQQAPCDRVPEVAVGLLEQPGRAELVLVSEVGELILGLSEGGASEVQ